MKTEGAIFLFALFAAIVGVIGYSLLSLRRAKKSSAFVTVDGRLKKKGMFVWQIDDQQGHCVPSLAMIGRDVVSERCWADFFLCREACRSLNVANPVRR